MALSFKSFGFLSGHDQNNLVSAIERSDIRALESLCDDPAIDLNKRDDAGQTPLMIAVTRSLTSQEKRSAKLWLSRRKRQSKQDNPFAQVGIFHGDIVEILIQKGADINAQDNAGNSALHLALKNKRYVVAAFLIDEGASVTTVNAQNENGFDLMGMEISKASKELLRARLRDYIEEAVGLVKDIPFKPQPKSANKA